MSNTTESIGGSEYNNLLDQARGSARYWIPKLCNALRNEDSKMSNADIRDRIEKDCIETWQKPTIRNALPEEYKDKVRVEQGKKGREKQLVAPTISQLGSKTENQPTESWANHQPPEQKEQESRTFNIEQPQTPKPYIIFRQKQWRDKYNRDTSFTLKLILDKTRENIIAVRPMMEA